MSESDKGSKSWEPFEPLLKLLQEYIAVAKEALELSKKNEVRLAEMLEINRDNNRINLAHLEIAKDSQRRADRMENVNLMKTLFSTFGENHDKRGEEKNEQESPGNSEKTH